MQVDSEPRRTQRSSLLFSSLLALSVDLRAQKQSGWRAAFDHEHSGANATDYMAAFPGGSPVDPPGGFFGWGEWGTGKFNAIHMSLIPKGPYRGQVLVWNHYPVFIDVGPALTAASGSRYWVCQAWSIVSPEANAPAPRFRNFLLPMEPWGNSAPTLASPLDVADIFCSGHAWSPAGDLVVAGGARYRYLPPGVLGELGAKFLYVWDPSQPTAPFPAGGLTAPLYPGEVGEWKKPVDPTTGQVLELAVDRYYPTVMLTHRLVRTLGVETMLIAGGSDPNQTSTAPGGSNPWNTYESYKVRPNVGAQLVLEKDEVTGIRVFRGPGNSTNTDLNWFLEYPRMNLLSDGYVFMSGWTPNGVRWNPEFPATVYPPTGSSAYDYSRGIGSGSVWNQLRDDGTTVFLARFGFWQDLVIRLGGANNSHVATTSTELLFAGGLNATWVSLGTMPGITTGRGHSNAVPLPDGSILAIGGDDPLGPYEGKVVRYTAGAGWLKVDETPTERRYHSAEILLPSGRVLVGGGEGRGSTAVLSSPHDYDLYEPSYLWGPTRPIAPTLLGIPQDAESTYLLSNNQTGIHLNVTLEGLDYLDRAVLMAPGSITHHSDMSARFVELVRTTVTSNEIIISIPQETVVPRGYYLLFAVTNGGVPAEAIWVKVQ